MQLCSSWNITNVRETPIKIVNAYICNQKYPGEVLVKDTASEYYGRYPIPAGACTKLRADFYIKPLTKRKKDLKLKLTFIDQYGQKIKKTTQFICPERHSLPIVELETESVAELTNEIERTIVSILKAEIVRYKANGRSTGELSSICLLKNGNRVTSIFQDNSNSRETSQQEIETDLDTIELTCENGDRLVDYYNSLTDVNDKSLFVNGLLSRVNRKIEFYCVSYLILYVMKKIGKLNVTLNKIKSSYAPDKKWFQMFLKPKKSTNTERHQRHGFSDALGLVNGLLRYAHNEFNEQDLDNVELFVNSISEHAFKIPEKINTIRASRI